MGACCARPIPDLEEELVSSPFFALDPEDLGRLSSYFHVQEFKEDDVLWDRGSLSMFFGVVQTGLIEEVFTVDGDEIRITKEDGESFGLAVLLRVQEPSNSLVRAKTDCSVYAIQYDQLWRFWRASPRAQNCFFSNQIIPIHEYLRQKVNVFASMDETNARLLSSLFRWKFISAHEVLFREDSLGDEFYIVAKGSCEVQVSVRELGDGEEPLIDQINRNNKFNTISSRLSQKNSPRSTVTESPTNSLATTPVTTPLAGDASPPSTRPSLKERLSKGDQSDAVHSDSEQPPHLDGINEEEMAPQASSELLRQPSRIATLYEFQSGDYFGEVSLIIDMPRTGSIVAKEDTILLELRAGDFRAFSEHDKMSLEKLRMVAHERMAESLRKYKIPIFSAVPLDKFPLLSRLSHVDNYSAGDVILNQGDANCGLHIIVHGEVGVFVRKKTGRKKRRKPKRSNDLTRLSRLAGKKKSRDDMELINFRKHELRDNDPRQITTPPATGTIDPTLGNLDDPLTSQIDPQLMLATESIQSDVSTKSAPGGKIMMSQSARNSRTSGQATETKHKKSNTGLSDIVRIAEDFRRGSESAQSNITAVGDDPDMKEIEVSLLTAGCYFGESSLRNDQDLELTQRPSGLKRTHSKKLESDLKGIRITVDGSIRDEKTQEPATRPAVGSDAVAEAIRLNREKTIKNLEKKGYKANSKQSRATFRCKTDCVVLRLSKMALDQFFEEVPDAKTWFDIILSRYDVDLHSMLANPISAQYFTWFLEHEWASENIKYYFAVREYKTAWENEQPEEQILEMAQIIGNSFIHDDGDDQINVAGDERRNLLGLIDAGDITPEMFDETQYSIFTLMERDSFPRFKQSRFFQEFIQKVDNYNLVSQNEFKNQEDQLRRQSTVTNVLGDKLQHAKPAGSHKIGGF